MKRETTTMALIIIALTAGIILSSVVVLFLPHASAANVCENKESNPNCFLPPLCGQPSCVIFEPGLPGHDP